MCALKWMMIFNRWHFHVLTQTNYGRSLWYGYNLKGYG